MSESLHLILVDGNTRRRAALSHGLRSGGQAHIEPFEDAGELTRHWRRDGLILAHDDGTTIATLVDHMTRSGSWLPLVAFAEAPTVPQVVRAMQAGVLDYLVWPFAQDELFPTLAAAEKIGRTQTRARLREATARNRIERLSGREREVLTGMASGLSNDLIAHELGISARTVEIHRANMLTKVGAKHSSEAVRVAIEAGLVE